MNSPARLAEALIRAASWRMAANVLGIASRFAIGIVLARLLPPSDFGIVALAMVVVGFAQPLGDFGIASAVIQRASLTDRHIRTAFTLASVLGVAITAVLLLTAPQIAALMRDERVTSVLRVLAPTFALQGTAVVSGAMLKRQLAFKQLFFVDTFSYLLGYGVVAVTMALAGSGVWSLVAAALAQTTIASAAMVLLVRHSMRPLFARKEASELLHFGIGSGATSWASYFAVNGDNFIVGRVLGASDLGLYSRAYSLMNLPYTYAASVISGVLFPAFAQIQGELTRMRRGYLLMTQLTALIAAPAMCVLAVAAPHLVIVLYGPKWAGTVVPLQILCFAGYFRSLYHAGAVVAQSVGRVYSDLWRQAVYAVLVIVGARIGSVYGLRGVAVGVSVAIVYMFVASGQLASRIVGISWREYLGVQRDALIIAALTGVAGFLARTVLEHAAARPFVVLAGIIVAAAIPWIVGALWKLETPELEPLQGQMPEFVRTMAKIIANFQPIRRF
jgi:PST family polysaccharide transporter